jgi:hypothetical protein
MRMPSYRHSQVLTVLWWLMPCVALASSLSILGTHATGAGLPVALTVALQAGLLLVFGRFTIELDNHEIEWHFGLLGWPRWRLPLSDIVSVEVARSSWREGWGIRRTREGMLYNAQGYGAVRIRKRDGSSLRLGTDEPERLKTFIEARLPRR